MWKTESILTKGEIAYHDLSQDNMLINVCSIIAIGLNNQRMRTKGAISIFCYNVFNGLWRVCHNSLRLYDDALLHICASPVQSLSAFKFTYTIILVYWRYTWFILYKMPQNASVSEKGYSRKASPNYMILVWNTVCRLHLHYLGLKLYMKIKLDFDDFFQVMISEVVCCNNLLFLFNLRGET